MLLTPTMIGAVLAGICLWTLFWAALHKIEEIPYVRDILTTNDCLDWIQQRPGLTILLTEAANYLAHGISSPIGVGFAMGGTIVNMLAVYGYIPSRGLLSVISAKLRKSLVNHST
jgi:hypothetical protein